MSAIEQIVVVSMVECMRRSRAQDETLREQIQAYTERLIAKSKNFLVFSEVLLQRSYNESASTKRRERAILQLQALVH